MIFFIYLFIIYSGMMYVTVRRDTCMRRLEETLRRLDQTVKRIVAGATHHHATVPRVVPLSYYRLSVASNRMIIPSRLTV